MIPSTVYPALHNHAPLAALVGDRIYRDWPGDVPAVPYVVWSILATNPDSNISGRPYSDRYSVSIDVFGNTQAQSDALAVAARDAMEAIGVMSSGPQSLGREPETTLWRYTFTVDVLKQR